MSIAVAEALLNTMGQSEEQVKAALVESMQTWGRRYLDAGYGGRFDESAFENGLPRGRRGSSEGGFPGKTEPISRTGD